MPAEGHLFIDQFGTTPTHLRPPADPWWKAGPRGRMELWRVFWVCFVFGHGVIIGIGGGLMVFAMVLGFAFGPGSLDAGFAGLASGGAILALTHVAFVAWCLVSVWRCAGNCIDRRWGYWARGFMVAYTAVIVLPVASWLMERSG